jgi:hypothetical protein
MARWRRTGPGAESAPTSKRRSGADPRARERRGLDVILAELLGPAALPPPSLSAAELSRVLPAAIARQPPAAAASLSKFADVLGRTPPPLHSPPQPSRSSSSEPYAALSRKIPANPPVLTLSSASVEQLTAAIAKASAADVKRLAAAIAEALASDPAKPKRAGKRKRKARPGAAKGASRRKRNDARVTSRIREAFVGKYPKGIPGPSLTHKQVHIDVHAYWGTDHQTASPSYSQVWRVCIEVRRRKRHG